MFDKSDDEKEEDEGEEAQWRKDRFEREKWLQEQQVGFFIFRFLGLEALVNC